jgi:23S rRNA (uracil1939-C5)-methyltransferase
LTDVRAPRFRHRASGTSARRSGGQVVEVDIEALAANGDGLATLRGQRISVPFTIPGERVRVRLSERVRAATLVDVLRPSAHRVAPRCRHFGIDAEPGLGACGGCTWQHIAYPEQLRLKSELVDGLVRAAVPRAPAVRPTLAATPVHDPWGYRNKVHFVFGNRLSTLTMGHYVRGSRRVIPVVECPVHDERGNTFAFAARDTFVAAGLESADGNRGTLRSLAIRSGCHTPELMATLIVSSDRDRRVRAATRRLLDQSPPTSMHLNIHARDDAFIFGAATRHLHGTARMREHVAGASFLMSPAAFFQTNVLAAELLVGLVLDHVETPRRVLDLYAGSGLFAIPLARAGNEVIAIEENRLAVADGEAALLLNPAAQGRCRFIGRRVESALQSISDVEVAVLDPPREGCSPFVITELFARIRPPVAIYISCNPEALAADLRAISRSGYQIRALQPVDMFPHTAHIETVVILERPEIRRKSLKNR